MNRIPKSILNCCNNMVISSTLNVTLLRQLTGSVLFFLLIVIGCATPPKTTLAPLPIPILNQSLLEGHTTITGSGMPNGTINVFLDGIPVTKGTTTANGTFDLQVSPLTAKQIVTATQTVAGQTSSHSLPVHVRRATLTQIEIHPVLPIPIDQGQTLAFTAGGLFSNGKTVTSLPGIMWSIEDPTVATIDSEGTVTGIKGGAHDDPGE